MEKRHLRSEQGTMTTIALESPFWESIEVLAESNGWGWHQWTLEQLDTKPHGVGRASWIRQSVLLAFVA